MLRTPPFVQRILAGLKRLIGECLLAGLYLWPAAGFVDTEIRCFMKLEVGYGETDIQSGIQG
jgi:hypothetical protein